MPSDKPKRKRMLVHGAHRPGIAKPPKPVEDKPPPPASAATVARNKRTALSARGSMTWAQVKRRLESRNK